MQDFFVDFETQLQLEKLVIGLEEPILIKGVGEFLAKVDSGNGGYNVIHGENVIQQGDIITFKTYDKNNNPKQVSKKLKEYINVNIGSGNIEERPVVELDVKFAGDLYKKIPFSVANRNSNSHKILICKDFVKNELDALIDPAGNNLTDKGVEVSYIKEGMGNMFGKTKNNTSSWAERNPKKANTLKYLGNLTTSLINAGIQIDNTNNARLLGDWSYNKEKLAGLMEDYAKIAEGDKELIIRKINKDKLYKNYGLSREVNGKDVLLFKLADYTGKYYGSGNDVVQSEKDEYNKVKNILDTKLQKESFNYNIYELLTEAPLKSALQAALDRQAGKDANAAQQQTQQPNQRGQTTNNQEQTTDNKNSEAEKQKDGDKVKAEEQKKQKELIEKYEKRKQFFIYFFAIGKEIQDKKSKIESYIENLCKQINLSEYANTLFVDLKKSGVSSNSNAIITFINILCKVIRNAEKVEGGFAFAFTDGSRKIKIYADKLVKK